MLGVSQDPIDPSWIAVLTDPVRLVVLRSLCRLGAATISELSRYSHTSDRTTRRHLEALVALGVAHEHRGQRDGITPGRPATRFAIDADAREQVTALFELLSDRLGAGLR
jgi:predicted ArsR family transcriptional regulator